MFVDPNYLFFLLAQQEDGASHDHKTYPNIDDNRNATFAGFFFCRLVEDGFGGFIRVNGIFLGLWRLGHGEDCEVQHQDEGQCLTEEGFFHLVLL